METQLAQGLTFLAWTTAVFLIVIGVFVVKVLIDLSKLFTNVNKSVTIVQSELEPIVSNISETTETVNKLVQTVGGRINKLSEMYDRATDAVINTVSKSGTLLKYVFKGICSSFKFFTKK